MRDFRKELDESGCAANHGCNVAKACMCDLADDAIQEIERLRAEAEEWKARCSALAKIIEQTKPGY